MWNIIFNISRLKNTRKELRNNATKTEKILWEKLKWSQFHWLKFRRQHSVGRYVLDFYCNSKKIWIELDWIHHLQEDILEYDKIRTEIIEKYWIRIIRIPDKRIHYDMNNVLIELEQFII